MVKSSVSFNKKKLGNIQSQKRKEIQRHKVERKAIGNSVTPEDKVVHGDEKRVITRDLASSDGSKKQVAKEEIQEFNTKKQKQENEFYKGRVEHFNKDKGYGFIKENSCNEKYFFHITDAFPDIIEGSIVSFELESGDRGTVAITIKPV
jgi:cold shock CspA family protein